MLNKLFENIALLSPNGRNVQIAQNPEIGMVWDTFGALAVDKFQIVALNSPEEILILEEGYPRGPRLKTVAWPDHLGFMQTQMPTHRQIEYKGIAPVTDAQLSQAKMFEEIWVNQRYEF